MSASYGKGDRGKATKLHSKVVRERARWRCECCARGLGDLSVSGKPVKQIHCAHIISRHTAATRTDESNAFCLCASCHWYFGKWPIEFAKFVFDKIGRDEYERLLAKALSRPKVNWKSEVERLEGVLRDLERRK